MAIYRSIQMSFWTDPKVIDAFTPEDKYFYLYLMTNPHTNLCGCYEISERQIENETGYTKKTIEKLMDRMCKVHKVISYSRETKEVLIVNWHKYNWTSSVKFRVPLEKEIQNVKNTDFKAFLEGLFNGIDTVSIPYLYGSDTTVTVTDTVTVLKDVNNKAHFPENEKLNQAFEEYVAYRKKIKSPLTDHAAELAIRKLNELSGGNQDVAIEILNQSIMNGWKGLFALKQDQGKPKKSKMKDFNQRTYDFSVLEGEAYS